MAIILGIDAAWTTTNPSGVALVETTLEGWRLVCAASSYENFIGRTTSDLAFACRPVGSEPVAEELLDASYRFTGKKVDVVCVDMPLAKSAITGRRCSDDAVSRKYGGRHASTHTPSAARPGVISNDLCAQFEMAGYPLCTTSDRVQGSALIEVYPHPALVELARSKRRLPYKYGKMRGYWPSNSPDERRLMLLQQWNRIVGLLEERISGVRGLLPDLDQLSAGFEWKAAEDILDAVVCAWIGMCFLEGKATAFGDEDSAIWIPNEGV